MAAVLAGWMAVEATPATELTSTVETIPSRTRASSDPGSSRTPRQRVDSAIGTPDLRRESSADRKELEALVAQSFALNSTTPTSAAEIVAEVNAVMDENHPPQTNNADLAGNELGAMEVVVESRPARTKANSRACCVCNDPLWPSEPGFKEFVYPCYCGHTYCGPCVANMFKIASRDSSTMPPACCMVIPTHIGFAFLTEEEKGAYRTAFDEWVETKPLYCPVPTCSTFIPGRLLPQKKREEKAKEEATAKENEAEADNEERPTVVFGTGVTMEVHDPNALGQKASTSMPVKAEEVKHVDCPTCTVSICLSCRQVAHADTPCATDELAGMRKLLKKWGYKNCPKCNHAVKRMFGCSHMQCLCGAHWCWGCRSPVDECDGYCGEPEDYETEDDEGGPEAEAADGEAPMQTTQAVEGATSTGETAVPEDERQATAAAAVAPEAQAAMTSLPTDEATPTPENMTLEAAPAATSENPVQEVAPVDSAEAPAMPEATLPEEPLGMDLDIVPDAPEPRPETPDFFFRQEPTDLPPSAPVADPVPILAPAPAPVPEPEPTQPPARRASFIDLDSGTDEHWRNAGLNFGDEPSGSTSTPWSCTHQLGYLKITAPSKHVQWIRREEELLRRKMEGVGTEKLVREWEELLDYRAKVDELVKQATQECKRAAECFRCWKKVEVYEEAGAVLKKEAVMSKKRKAVAEGEGAEGKGDEKLNREVEEVKQRCGWQCHWCDAVYCRECEEYLPQHTWANEVEEENRGPCKD